MTFGVIRRFFAFRIFTVRIIFLEHRDSLKTRKFNLFTGKHLDEHMCVVFTACIAQK